MKTARKLGATGKFPQGKLSRSDEGELKFAVGFDPTTNLVRIEFGKPVAWMAISPQQAIDLARSLLERAGAKKVEITL